MATTEFSPPPAAFPGPRRAAEDTFGQRSEEVFIPDQVQRLGSTAVAEVQHPDTAEPEPSLQQEEAAASELAEQAITQVEADAEPGALGNQAEAYAAAQHSLATGEGFENFGPAAGQMYRMLSNIAPHPDENPAQTAARREELALKMSQQPVNIPPQPRNPQPPASAA